jgi:cell fate (sporulation/competence/biofilm development) regulator YmcA (YheA/YmcA/DUF963 family)
MEKNVSKALDKVILDIKNSAAYKKTLLLKEQMNNNKEITAIIEEIKSLQKEYVKSKDIKIKKRLSYLENKLNHIPLYHEYNNNLEEVNQMIEVVKDNLNQYFSEIFK